MRGNISARQSKLFPFGIYQGNSRADILARSGTLARIHHRDAAEAGELIGLTLNGHALFHTAELHGARHLSDDGVCVWIPCSDDITRAHLSLITHFDGGTIRHLVTLTLTAHLIQYGKLSGARHRHQRTISTVNHLDVVELHHTI